MSVVGGSYSVARTRTETKIMVAQKVNELHIQLYVEFASKEFIKMT